MQSFYRSCLRAYPEVFAAIGVHSGLPFGIAHDAPSAFAAMKRGAPRPQAVGRAQSMQTVPAIVFHGDRDTTVDLRNGTGIVAQCLDATAGGGEAVEDARRITVERGTVPGGGLPKCGKAMVKRL